METIKQRPAWMPTQVYEWQFSGYCNQNLELLAQYGERIRLEDEEDKKLQQWQKQMSKLEEAQSKGAIIHTHTWVNMQNQMDEIGRQKTRLKCDKERLSFNIGLAGEKMYSYYKDISNDYYNQYISEDQFKKYLLRYHQILKAGKGFIVFTEDATSKIQAAINKYLPTLPNV